jgi:threonylcarbamoyladenosine tRNA methylthiotransferase MtaB
VKIKITSLGCRLNQSEIESVSTRLQDMGHEIAKDDTADIYIFNSCSVTGKSEKKVRNLISRARKSSPAKENIKIIVTGCSSDDFSGSPEILFVPNDYKYLIPEIVDRNLTLPDILKEPASRFSYAAPVKSSTVRANLKIQDGCDNFCSYCIIPYLRGKPLSKPSDIILSEFGELLNNGYKEIVLTGVNIGKYNYDETGLDGLVEKILANHNSDFRLHLTSLDPDSSCDRLIGLYKDPRMVKHLHLSLQSGSDSVLNRMNRPYTRDDYTRVTEKIKQIVADFNFTTDVIVGFPGETENEFNDTISLVREVGFSHIHTFRYSPREGTKAYNMSNLVDEKIKKDRSRITTNTALTLKKNYYRKFNSRRTVFLSEKSKESITTGFNNYYVPIEIEGRLSPNRFYEVITEFNEKKYKLSGTVIAEGA